MGKLVKLGSFCVECNKIIVTDTSYDYSDYGILILKNVLAGKYFANVTMANLNEWGQRITSLNIFHSDYRNTKLKFSLCGGIGVDSGQAGFFDENYFVENQGGEFGDLNSFYGLACSITLSPKQAGVMRKKGVVSSSGFGDGFYDVFVCRNSDGKIVAAKILFIAQDDSIPVEWGN